jgi:hypothetical protein
MLFQFKSFTLLKTKTQEFTKSFSKLKVPFPSSRWSTGFPKHATLLKRVNCHLPHVEDFHENPGKLFINRKKGMKMKKKMLHAFPSLIIFAVTSKAFGVKRQKTSHFF